MRRPFETSLYLWQLFHGLGVAHGLLQWRLTGHAAVFPYVLNARTYESAGLFSLGSSPRAAALQQEQFEEFYSGWELRTTTTPGATFGESPPKN